MQTMPQQRAIDAPQIDFDAEARHLHDRLARSFKLVGKLRTLAGTLTNGFHPDEVVAGIETLREQIEGLEADLAALASSDEAEDLTSALEDLAAMAEDRASATEGGRAWAELHSVAETCRVRVAGAMSAAERNRRAWADVRMRLLTGADAVSTMTPEQVQKLQRALSTPMTRMSAVMQARDAISQRVEHIEGGLSLGEGKDADWRLCADYLIAAQLEGLAETLSEVRESATRESGKIRKAIAQHWDKASGGLEDLAELISDIALLGPARAASTLDDVRQAHPQLQQAIERLKEDEDHGGGNDALPSSAQAVLAAFPAFLDDPCRKVLASLGDLSTAAVEFQKGLGLSDPIAHVRRVLEDLDRDIGRLERSAEALRQGARMVAPDGQPPIVEAAVKAMEDLYTAEEERTVHSAALGRIG